MPNKTKKAQVVLAAIDQAGQTFDFLLLKVNEQRGSFWQNVTGKLEENETFEEGGLREAIEETQLKIESIVDIINLNLKFEFVDQRKRQVVEESFLIILDEKWNVVLDPSEHQDYKWVPFNEITADSVKFQSNMECLIKAQKLLRHWGG